MRMFPATFPVALNPFARVAAFCLFLCFATGAAAATFTVTTTADSGAGSLRQAVADTNTLGGTNTIVFAPALSGQTIKLLKGIPFLITSDGDPLLETIIDATALPLGLT